MKKNILLFIGIIFTLFNVKINGQASIWFTDPSNGETIHETGYGSTQTTIPVFLNYNFQTSGDPNIIGTYVKLFPTPYGTQQSPNIDQWWYLARALISGD